MRNYNAWEDEGSPSASGKVRVNFGTLALIALIAVFAFLIVRYIVTNRARESGFDVTDVYGNSYAQVTPTPEPDKRPEAEGEGLLPIFYSARTDEKQVAITIQGAASESQLEALLQASMEYGAKLTFFLNGDQLVQQRGLWATALLMGHEIESRGMTGKRLQSLSPDELESEIGDFDALVKAAFGEEYAVHFLRTDVISDDEYEPLHACLAARGYKGIARWAKYKPTSFEQIEPGQIIGFDLGSSEIKQITAVMKTLSENGYQMLTLNGLFEYEANLFSAESE